MKQDYIYLDFEENLDAYYYHQICPSVTITDSETRKYLSAKAYGWPHFFEEYKTFFNEMPERTTGKFHQSNRKIIDYWELASPGGISSMIAVVSQRFVDVLGSIGVNKCEYYLKKIDIANNKSAIQYYLFMVPVVNDNHIVYEDSVFVRHRSSPNEEKRIFESEQDRLKNSTDYLLTYATLKFSDGFPDIINFRGCAYIFVSPRLFKALESAGLRGYRVSKEETLKVISGE